MLDINALLAGELNLQHWQVQNVLALLDDGATIPFIARYRKERTGEMDDVTLRTLKERHEYLTELEDRKQTILASIKEQGKLTDELERRIIGCTQKTELEDLYLPYRPKRRTRATIARERGLEPLALGIEEHDSPDADDVDLLALAAPFVDPDKEVPDAKAALQGAADIIAENIAEQADLRQTVRAMMLRDGTFVSRIKAEIPEGSTKFEMYRDFRAPVSSIAAHTMLALRRGEAEEVLSLFMEIEEDGVLSYLREKVIRRTSGAVADFKRTVVKDAYDRLMKFTLIGEVRFEKKQGADADSIRTFETNLRNLLLSAPAGMKPTLGIDPGFRTGCKFAVVDATSRFIEHATVYPTAGSADQRQKATMVLRDMIRRHGIELIAIGNGTAGRETEQFVAESLETLASEEPKPTFVMVSEAGASVYSASETAGEEFPDLDVTIRGAISIARRLQDPLAELVKIDPKSIGVGQYQHDVDQRLLKKNLEETVESCVNYVGVDLNTASKELLGYVSGITPTLARNIVEYRNQNGPFASRETLLKVPKFGPKTFEQSAGFLRIRNGSNPLDNSAVHPERYPIVEVVAKDLGVPLSEITKVPDRIRSVDISKYVNDSVGLPTLRDVIAELEKPGRDPRAQFRYATFQEGVKEITDLKPDMELEGVVTNVANFGAFVDIGVHQDGLVHVSQLADRFVKDPKDVVSVGQVVKVRVVEVDVKLKRISLTMKKKGGHSPSPKRKSEAQSFSMDDLKAKFAK